jgi:sugar phosphate isomerase/epimerase
MRLSRRSLLASGVAAAASRAAAAAGPSTSLGLVVHSFPLRGKEKGFAEAVRFFDYCRTLGAGGVQVGIGVRDDAYADDLRARSQAASMFVEGIVSLPRDEADVARFEAEIRTARRAGATVVRTAALRGRRYETFDSAAAFRRYADQSLHAMKLAAPVVTRHAMRLAVENHKDWRADELIALLKRVGCDQVGVCLDTGNSIALLEDPMDVVEALAPQAFSTHIKDMGVEEYPEGFLLSEVPLGTGILDLPKVVSLLRKAHPEVRLVLEMITRDPLKVPCLTEHYWTTFADLPGRHLARTLSLVRAHAPSRPLPRISGLTPAEQLQAEDENIRRCLAFGRGRLGL